MELLLILIAGAVCGIIIAELLCLTDWDDSL